MDMDIAGLIADKVEATCSERYVKFDDDDKAIAHLKRATALKFGDEVKFYEGKNKKTRGVFLGWCEVRALILFRDTEGDLCYAKMVPSDIIFND